MRRIETVHKLGVRPTFELFDEIVRHHPQIADDLDRRLERYSRLDPEMVRLLGGDRLPPLPLRVVR